MPLKNALKRAPTSTSPVAKVSTYDHQHHVVDVGAGGAGDDQIVQWMKKVVGVVVRKKFPGVHAESERSIVVPFGARGGKRELLVASALATSTQRDGRCRGRR